MPPSAPSLPEPHSFLELNSLFSNPVFAGGIGLAGLGATAAFARRLALRAAALLKRRLLVDIEIGKQDTSYQWILSWLALPRTSPSSLVSGVSRVHHLSMKTTSPNLNHNSEAENTHFLLQPGYGRYLIQYGGAFISVKREKQSAASLDGREPYETITLTTLYAHRQIFENIFMEAHRLAVTAQEGKTVMYTAKGLDWVPFGDARRKRPLDSVVLESNLKETIVKDVDEFLNSQEWYIERGIPYRRGYLLHGPPGGGKTSFIQALAGYLNFGIAIANLSERGMTDDKLALLLTKLPKRTILLLEDADAAFSNRRLADEYGYNGGTVTFSGLLNAMDGVAAGEERISFLTTNHIDRMDPALIRPGRVDMKLEIGAATKYQAVEMFKRFYPGVDAGVATRFGDYLHALGIVSVTKHAEPKFPTSTAAIQALFLFNKDLYQGAFRDANTLVPKGEQGEKDSEPLVDID